jgi:protein SCO1
MDEWPIGRSSILLEGNPWMRRFLLVGIGVLAALLLVTGYLFVSQPHTLHGAVIDPPAPVAEIQMTDQSGQPFRLRALRGRIVLLYFGYTNCPDECPLTMAHLKLAVDQLGNRGADVRVMMVTTDPIRDTTQALKLWLGKFNPSFIGVTGSTDQLAKTWRDYGVTVENGGETHSFFIYVIDRSGNLRETLLPDSLPQDISSDVNLLLNGN